jgi:hypothetical protein
MSQEQLTEEGTDSSKFDHLFWIGPGETDYIIEGFYVSASKSRAVVHRLLPKVDVYEGYHRRYYTQCFLKCYGNDEEGFLRNQKPNGSTLNRRTA